MSDPTPLDTARRVLDLDKQATEGPWRPEREPPPVGNAWFDDLPKGAVPIESTGTAFALGVAVAGVAYRHDAALIAEYRTAAPALARALLEAQAALAAANARIEAFRASVADTFVPSTAELVDLRAELQAANARADKYAETIAEHTVPLDQFTDMEQERDALAKRAFTLADEAEQAQDCGESQSSECCGECIACRDVTLADTVEKYDAARAEAETLRRERDRNEREVQRLQNVVCASPACSAAIVRRDDGSRVCAAGHPARWVNVDLLTKSESQIATARESVRELVAVVRECRMHAVGYAPESLVTKIDALLARPANAEGGA